MTRRRSDPGVLTRRAFLARTGLVATGVVVGLAVSGCGGSNPGHVTIYALSGRGRRVSNAAKSHNANMRFTSPFVALANRAHPGDTSQVVPLDVSMVEFERLFRGFATIADLRHV